MPGGIARIPGDVVDGQVAVVAQRQDDPVVGAQTRDRPADGVAIVDVGGRVPDAGVRSLGDVDGGPASRAPEPVTAGVHEDAVEPRLEPLGVPQGRELEPGGDERIMDRILSGRRIPEDRRGPGGSWR